MVSVTKPPFVCRKTLVHFRKGLNVRERASLGKLSCRVLSQSAERMSVSVLTRFSSLQLRNSANTNPKGLHGEH